MNLKRICVSKGLQNCSAFSRLSFSVIRRYVFDPMNSILPQIMLIYILICFFVFCISAVAKKVYIINRNSNCSTFHHISSESRENLTVRRRNTPQMITRHIRHFHLACYSIIIARCVEPSDMPSATASTIYAIRCC